MCRRVNNILQTPTQTHGGAPKATKPSPERAYVPQYTRSTAEEQFDVHQLIAQIAESQKQTSAKPIRRLRSKKRIIVDIFCGRCSLAKYYLQTDSNAIILCIDKRPREDALSEIPAHHLARVRYVRMNVHKLNVERLKGYLIEMCGASKDAPLRDIYQLHASPDCSTYSNCHSQHTAYRFEDGTIDDTIPEWKRKIAEQHDLLLKVVMQMVREVAWRSPHTLITLENPVGTFHLQPCVRETYDGTTNAKFRLLETHYCKAAVRRLDGDLPWSKKPTHILIRGGEEDLVLPQCKNDCPYRLPDLPDGTPGRHRNVMRLDHNSAQGQV